MIKEDTIIPITLGGSYVYTANTAAAFLTKKAYPYFPAPPPNYVEFKKYTMNEAGNLDLEAHCQKISAVYNPFVKDRKFDALIFGAPNGAIVHLAVAMGVPYLCSQFRIPIKLEDEYKFEDKDDLTPYAELVKYIGKKWTIKYPWGNVSCLVDPIHDRMDLGEYAHVREKFTAIPKAFKEFMKNSLKPNGTVIFANVTYPWKTYRLQDSVYLQIGGLGDIAPDEFIKGSERINQFLKEEKSEHFDGWKLHNYELVQRTESEWGTEPELKKAVQEFCGEHGYGFMPQEGDHPAKFNLLATHAMHRKHTWDGGCCRGWSINIFWSLCPTLVVRARLLSCWFTFTDKASLRISEQQLKVLLNEFPDVPQTTILGYYWSNPDAKLLDIIPPSGWLSMLSKYIPAKDVILPGIKDLENTEHDIFQYEDELYEKSKKYEGKESKHNVTMEELREMTRLSTYSRGL